VGNSTIDNTEFILSINSQKSKDPPSPGVELTISRSKQASIDITDCLKCTYHINLTSVTFANHSFTLTASTGLAITRLVDNQQVRVFVL
jgi:hypothetical protein